MTQFNEVLQPIICDPYAEPQAHWIVERGRPAERAASRREAYYYHRPPGRSTGTGQADDIGTRVPLTLVNEIRDRLRAWREGYEGVTAVTAELLAYWNRPDRERRLFFCQREAIETIVFLIEARADFRQGLNVPLDAPGEFVRYACKMATGSGKTTVMAALAAWSILNKVADRGDRRFSEVVLVVCPNVTIRDRLQELDPQRGEASLYRVRDLVPAHRMSDLRRGHVLIRNWHVLAPLELNQVGGVGARVVQRGRESDTALVSRLVGPAVRGKGNLLVLNDEAHHAYRIRRDAEADAEDDDDELAEADRREATVWIEGLDRLHRGRGINLCLDLSATPFYLTRSGNDPGRAFPWVVSDFGLIDAIESGLVKIPQLPVQDATGREIPVYFHLWKWIVEEKLTGAERGGRRGQVRPEAVLRWAQQPIAQLAGLWREEFVRWRDEAARGARPPVPPVFIVVCRDTRLARVVHEWLTGAGPGAAPPIDEFRNTGAAEYTVRIDSRVVEELSSGTARSDESRRLRFVLDTIGRVAWPGGRPPEEYLDLVEKLNAKAREEGRPLVDASIPPGRDVRCIVSVAMLTEGWDATTVTHIVGLRPFESQLLCEQVIGRGLRRAQYHDLSVEEVAKVYGVPFELIPLKATPGTPAPPPRVHHVHTVSPDRDHLEIRFPRVEGYAHAPGSGLRVAWERVPVLTLDPQEIPDEVRVKGLSADRGGRLSLMGPGATDEVTLEAWRRGRRLQELEFELARVLTLRLGTSDALPAQVLFPRLLAIVRRFVRERVDPSGRRDKRDVFLEPYFSWATDMLAAAIVPDSDGSGEIARYESHRGAGSTRDVDFWTSRPVWEAARSHVNYVVADTGRWEQSAAFALDGDEHVVAFVKNAGLGFAIPYTRRGQTHEYVPDFLVRLRQGEREVGTLVLETKGYDPAVREKIAGAERWVAAVNAEDSYGRWAYRVVFAPGDVPRALRSAAAELADPPRGSWREALARLVAELRAIYGTRLDRVVLYGSRARGDAVEGSDVDALVVLDRCDDFWTELDRIADAASVVSFEYGVTLSALPVGRAEFERGERPLFQNARREGVVVS